MTAKEKMLRIEHSMVCDRLKYTENETARYVLEERKKEIEKELKQCQSSN